MKSAAVVCQELVELVTGYLDDTLTPERRAAVESHLLGCGDCSTYVEQMRVVIALQAASVTGAGTPREDDLPAGMLDGVLSAFRARGSSSTS